MNEVKAERRKEILEQGRKIRRKERGAEERREQLLRKRKDLGGERQRKARALRERSEEKKKREARDAKLAREEAAERRGRLLEERRGRAARFSPTRGRVGIAGSPSGSPIRSFSPSNDSMRSFSPGSPARDVSPARSLSPLRNGIQLQFDDDDAENNLESPSKNNNEDESTDKDSPSAVPNLHPMRSGDDEEQDVDQCDFLSSSAIGSESEGAEGGDIVRELSNDETRAARKMVGIYYLSKARTAMEAAGVLGQRLKNYTFEDITACLKMESAQAAVDLVFRALGKRHPSRTLNQSMLAREKAERRILLSCLVIALHPEAVMEEKVRRDNISEPISVDRLTVYSARRMLLCLQAGSLSSVANAWVHWRQAFLRWKQADKENLLKALIEDAVATDALSKAIDMAFREEENIAQVNMAIGGDNSLAVLRRQEHNVWKTELSRKQDKLREAVLRLSGTDGERRLSAALAAANAVQDEKLVHEILVDLQGLLQRIESTSTVPEECWHRMQQELEATPPIRDELSRRLHDISRMLNSMIPGCFSLLGNESSVALDETFTIGLISRAVEALEKCQAEVDDDALRGWYSVTLEKIRHSGRDLVTAVVESLSELSKRIGTVRTEVMKYRILHSTEVVQEYGAAWERSQFQGHIVSKRFSGALPRTRKVFEEHKRNGQDDQEDKPLKDILVDVVIGMIMKDVEWREHEIPEIMHLDLDRLRWMQNEVQKAALCAGLGNIGRQVLHTKGLKNRGSDLSALADVTSRDDVNLADVQTAFVKWVREEMEKGGVECTENDRDLLRGMVQRVAKPGDATFGLMRRRVGDRIRELCTRRNRNCTSRGYGLEGMEETVIGVVRRVEHLTDHLQVVYGAWVMDVVRSV